MKNLPTKLGKEPLIDVGFELRFASSQPVSNLLPGVLAGRLQKNGEISIERQGASDIPAHFRQADPNLKYMPLVSMKWGNFIIGISDFSLSVTCGLPYPGWQNFRSAIQEVLNCIKDASYITALERHSLKYVDLLEIEDPARQISAVNMAVALGGHALKNETFLCRMDIPEGDYVKIIQIVSNASFILNNVKRSGIVVDVDIIRQLSTPISDYLQDLPQLLAQIHLLNKETFFGCLTKETIDSLEPNYE